MSPRGLCVVLVASWLVACGSSQAPAAQTSGAAYELVVMEKPDSVVAYAKHERSVYDLCVLSAQLNHQQVKPFPSLPASLGSTRKTYLVRGRDRVFRQELLASLDISKMTPSSQCEVDIVTNNGPDVDLMVGSTHTSVGTDDSGHPTVHTEDVSDLRRAQGTAAESTAKYTEASTVNGIELRCLPQGKPPIDGNQLQQLCVYARDNVLVEPDGKPIVLASRVKPTPNYPVVTIDEPQSLRTLEQPDANLFKPETYTR